MSFKIDMTTDVPIQRCGTGPVTTSHGRAWAAVQDVRRGLNERLVTAVWGACVGVLLFTATTEAEDGAGRDLRMLLIGMFTIALAVWVAGTWDVVRWLRHARRCRPCAELEADIATAEGRQDQCQARRKSAV